MECSYGNGGAISPDFCVPASLPGMLSACRAGSPIRWARSSCAGAGCPRQRRGSCAGFARDSLEPRGSRVGGVARVARAEPRALRPAPGRACGRTHREDRPDLRVAIRSRDARPKRSRARCAKSRVWSRRRSTPTQIRALDPDLAPGFARGLFFPDNGHTVNPLRLVQTLVELFVEAGGRLERRKVDGIRARRRDACKPCAARAATTLPTDAVVHRHRHPLAQVRERRSATRFRSKPSAAITSCCPIPRVRPKHQDQQPRPHVRPDADGARRAHLRARSSSRIPDAPMDERRARSLLVAREAHVPGAQRRRRASSGWGSRPSTPDSLPVVDRASRARNVVYAFGHGHTGLTGAPMTADLVAAIADGPHAADRSFTLTEWPTRF